MARDEIDNLLSKLKRDGLITDNATDEINRLLARLVATKALVGSRSEGFLVGEQYVGILPEFSQEARQTVEEDHKIIVSIEPLSLTQLLERSEFDPYHGSINESPSLRAITPPKTQIAFDPDNFVVPASNNTNPTQQKEMVARLNERMQDRLGRRDVAMLLWPGLASAMIQMEYQFQKLCGKPLIVDSKGGFPFYLRTIDGTEGSGVADVGRGKPSYNLIVADWLFGISSPRVWAPALIVPVGPLVR